MAATTVVAGSAAGVTAEARAARAEAATLEGASLVWATAGGSAEAALEAEGSVAVAMAAATGAARVDVMVGEVTVEERTAGGWVEVDSEEETGETREAETSEESSQAGDRLPPR